MTKSQLLKLNDQLTLWMEQVEDLTEQFNGSGNLTDDVHQFSREYISDGTGHTTDILLKSMALHGVLTALQFEVTEVILTIKGDEASALRKKSQYPTTVTEVECPTCGWTIELVGYDGKGYLCTNCNKVSRPSEG